MAQKRKSKMVHAHTTYDKGGAVRAMILWKIIKLSQHSHTHTQKINSRYTVGLNVKAHFL